MTGLRVFRGVFARVFSGMMFGRVMFACLLMVPGMALADSGMGGRRHERRNDEGDDGQEEEQSFHTDQG